MKKRLFTEKDYFNEDARQFEEEVESKIIPLVKKWADKDFSVRDIEHLLICLITTICSEERIHQGLKARAEKKSLRERYEAGEIDPSEKPRKS